MSGFANKPFIERFKLAIKDKEILESPILIKDGISAKQKIEKLSEDLKVEKSLENQKELIKKIKLLELGLYGEKSVQFELLNSFLPIHIHHDINLKHEELKAQYDFVVLTRKFILIIEVKNYYGNIQVTENGDFIRNVVKGEKIVFQEGFYSPIRQVERQVEVLQKFMKVNGIIGSKTPIKHVVVFTNTKTILNLEKADQNIQNKIVRVDRLVEYIKKELKKTSPIYLLDNRMTNISNFLKSSHKDNQLDNSTNTIELKLLDETIESLNNTDQAYWGLEDALRKFRKEKAAELGIKAFYIFTNQTLEEIVLHQPKSLNQLSAIRGIGEQKLVDFGHDILQIIIKSNK